MGAQRILPRWIKYAIRIMALLQKLRPPRCANCLNGNRAELEKRGRYDLWHCTDWLACLQRAPSNRKEFKQRWREVMAQEKRAAKESQ